jgi:uncharacterized membrane protein (UPF0127 family)
VTEYRGVKLRLIIATIIAGTTAWAAWSAQGSDRRLYPLSELSKATVGFGAKRIPVWVMDTAGKRAEGMMYLSPRQVPTGAGMLFVFDAAREMSFWNQNVAFDLDVAYIDGKGRVVSVVVLKAQDPTPKPSGTPAIFVLEMKRGEFKRLGIRKGSPLRLPANVRAH